ncbi:hypothetical protein ACLOJK_021604 [Asimina triloba]
MPCKNLIVDFGLGTEDGISNGDDNALVLPRLSWKWMRHIGKVNTSPGYKIFVMSVSLGLEVTNPTRRVPSKTVRISLALG